MPELEIQFRALNTQDNRAEFCSGNIELDRFFQRYAGQNQFRHHIGMTYVITVEPKIIGFVTVSAGEITVDDLPLLIRQRLPEYPLPIMRIARLAIDKQFQGIGLGKKILRASLQLALDMRTQYGCVGVVVDAKQESIAFYEKLGFILLHTVAGELGDRPEPTPLFLPIQTIEKARSSD